MLNTVAKWVRYNIPFLQQLGYESETGPSGSDVSKTGGHLDQSPVFYFYL